MSKKTEKINKTCVALDELKKKGVPVYALIYCRVSSDRQAKEGNGLDSQKQRCVAFANATGLIVGDEQVFTDVISGGDEYTNREGLSKLLSYIDANPLKSFVFVIDDMSRLARDVKEHFRIRVALRQRGVEVTSPNFQFEDSPEGEMIETMLAATNQYYRKNNTRQVVQKMRARLELGFWPFAPKVGYKKDPDGGKVCVVSEKGREFLKPALEGFANGRFPRKIDACRFLCEQHFFGKNPPERYLDMFTKILTDPFYAGDIEYVGTKSRGKSRKRTHQDVDWDVTRRKGFHEGIISLETFDLIQKRIKRESLNKRVRVETSSDFPLRGLMSCEGCGRPFTGAWTQGKTKEYAYYFCQTKDCALRKKSISKAKIESEFCEMLKDSTMNPKVENLAHVIFERVWKREIAKFQNRDLVAQKEKDAIEEKIKQYMEEMVKSKNETLHKVYEKQLEKLSEEIEQLDEKPIESLDLSIPYRTLIGKAVSLFKSPYSVWEILDPYEKKKLFYFIFEDNLSYHPIEGYRTQKTPQAIRIFEEFVEGNSNDVEMGRIELPCKKVFRLRSTNIVHLILFRNIKR